MIATAADEVPGRDPAPDSDEDLRRHVSLVHELAAPLAGRGKLVLARFGEDPETGRKSSPLVRHFEIGDVEGMITAIRQLGAERDRNLYVPLAVMRPDLPKAQKGFERDVVAVLALTCDFDDERAADYDTRGPLAPDYVLETSADRFQSFYLLDEPATVAEAKPVAEALKAYAGCDHGTSDLSHVWRIGGTQNWPNKKKVTEGRPREPQPVRVVVPWNGGRTSLAELRAAIEKHAAPKPNGANGHADCGAHNNNDWEADDATEGYGLLLASLPEGLRERITEPTLPGEDRSARAHFVIAALVERGLTDERIEGLIRAHPKGVGERYVRDGKDLGADILRVRSKLTAKQTATPGSGQGAMPPVLDPRDPLAIARALVAAHLTRDGLCIARHHRDAFYRWTGAHYIEWSDAEVRAAIYRFLEPAMKRVGNALGPFKPTAARVSDVLDALRAVAHLADRHAPPLWLDRRSDPPAHDILPCRNGLLHLPTRTLITATPTFFGFNTVDFSFDENALEPKAWTTFLASLWPTDSEAIDTLQEIFGYCLTPDTRQQKAFLLVGPKRSGKGTIARVLKALLGGTSVAGPTLSGLGSHFGLAPLIGKPLAIVADARLSGRADQHVIAERVLSITGEDVLTIDRKHREAWTGTLPTRFLLLTNELPRIADASGALASRFVVLTLTESFYGKEDHGLTDRLLGELPGILNWAITGRERLHERGRFQQPASSAEAIERLEDLGSIIGAFLRECCVVEPGRMIECAALFDYWKLWCERQGRDHPGTVQSFGRDLHAAVPGLKTTQPSDGQGGKKPRHYVGLDLRP